MSSSARKIGVLLVDDDPIVLMDMAQSLTEAGFVVFEARNADEALRVLSTEPDVLMTITDVDMRDGSLDGFQLAQVIAMRWPEIGLLIISGQSRPRVSDLPEGARFLTKPCEPRRWSGACSPSCLSGAGRSSGADRADALACSTPD